MGYVFLSVSLFFGALKGFCGKKLGAFADGVKSAVFLNLVRMVLCLILGAAIVLFTGNTSAVIVSPSALFISALSGISTAFFVVSWLFSVRENAYMLLDVFLMLGTLVPVISGSLLFSEPILPRQWVGFASLMIAALIMCSYQETIKTKLKPISFFLLLFCGFSNGITDLSQKLFVKLYPLLSVSIFNLYTYFFASVTLLIISLLLKDRNRVQMRQTFSKRSLFFLIIMAFSLTANSYFKTIAAAFLDSAKLYPLNQGIALTLSTLMATFFFHERFTLRAFFGIALAFFSLILINL